MGKNRTRRHVLAEIAHVLVVPGGFRGAIQCRFRNILGIPTHAKAVTIGRFGTFGRCETLQNDGMFRTKQNIKQRLWVAHVSEPTAHYELIHAAKQNDTSVSVKVTRSLARSLLHLFSLFCV